MGDPLRIRRQVGRVRVTLDFRLMRNQSDTEFELVTTDDDTVLLTSRGLNGIHDKLTTKFVDAGIDNFHIDVTTK